MVAAREATVPAATAAASSCRTGGRVRPAMPAGAAARRPSASRRRASAALIRSRARRNSAVFRYPSSAAAASRMAAADTRRQSGHGGVAARQDAVSPAFGHGISSPVPVPCSQPRPSRPLFHPVSQPAWHRLPTPAGRPPSRRPVCASGPPRRHRRSAEYSTVRDRSSTSSAKSDSLRRSPTGRRPQPQSQSTPEASASAAATAAVHRITLRSIRERLPAGEAGRASRAGRLGLIRDELSNSFHNSTLPEGYDR